VIKYNGIINHKQQAMALLKTDYARGNMGLWIFFILFRVVIVC